MICNLTCPLGQYCGSIVWESKRTKNWSDGWLPKLRDDQVALIVLLQSAYGSLDKPVFSCCFHERRQ